MKGKITITDFVQFLFFGTLFFIGVFFWGSYQLIFKGGIPYDKTDL